MNNPERIDPLKLIDALAEKERQLSETTFVAPVIAGGKVRVRVDGVIYDMRIDDRAFQGWGVFQMTSPGNARLVEPASLSLIADYLKLFSTKEFVLIAKFGGHWFALPASTSDARFKVTGPTPIYLVGENKAGNFDSVIARCDGNIFFFDSLNRRRDPAVARALRRALENKKEATDLRVRGMTQQERLAYRILFLQRYTQEAPQDARATIAQALNHAGATLDVFWHDEREGRTTVRFVVDGELHTVQITPDDMTLLSAGVCLRGRDRDFDLASVVGVLREARQNYDDW